MPSLSSIAYYAVRPHELRAIIQWGTWHDPVHERKPEKESPELRKCFEFLDMTSRSFAAVIKELHPELLVPVCLFYLVLRGLDTIEDDMTIALEEKEPLLRNFHNILEEDGWTYEGNHVGEKDRDLLVQFHYVITEFKKIKPAYKKIIKDIAKRMGDGMADYCNKNDINTVAEYEKYCHYVAGLVGEGLTRLFVESELANPALLTRPELMESMGQFLQQTNVIRDIHEDWEDKRRFWPREIWSKYVDNFEDLFKPENKAKALNASSEMVWNALKRADDCLFYLAGLREQSVFNFCAIPQAMAISTLALCFQNADMFQRNIKISRGEACQVMLDSTQNMQALCDVFKTYARKIHHKNNPQDPSFLKISIACGRIEQFIESIFPSQKPGQIKSSAGKLMSPEELAKQKQAEKESMWDMFYLMIAVILTLALVSGIMIGVAWLAGARFDIAFNQMKKGQLIPPTPGTPEASKAMEDFAHKEL